MSFDVDEILLVLTVLMEVTAGKLAMRIVDQAVFPFFGVWQVRDAVEGLALQGSIRLIWIDRGRAYKRDGKDSAGRLKLNTI